MSVPAEDRIVATIGPALKRQVEARAASLDCSSSQIVADALRNLFATGQRAPATPTSTSEQNDELQDLVAAVRSLVPLVSELISRHRDLQDQVDDLVIGLCHVLRTGK